jgi:hypothetical protein
MGPADGYRGVERFIAFNFRIHRGGFEQSRLIDLRQTMAF